MSSLGQSQNFVVPNDRVFNTTHWSVVLVAGDSASSRAAEALEELCRTYWYPLFAYVRREGYSPEDAQDLTQGFFACFLEKDYLAQVAREKGKFRSFLLVSLKHFLSDERDRTNAIKRGGGKTILSLDVQEAEGRYLLEPAHDLSAEKIFERRWALMLLDRVVARLREEYAAAGKADRFAVLETFLPGEQATGTYTEVGDRLGLAEGTIKWEVHQLKKRYRELLRTEIAHTVSSPDEIDEEARYLIAVLSG
jgi:RNA polymerase sigma-70 factor (ECF subfamily)